MADHGKAHHAVPVVGGPDEIAVGQVQEALVAEEEIVHRARQHVPTLQIRFHEGDLRSGGVPERELHVDRGVVRVEDEQLGLHGVDAAVEMLLDVGDGVVLEHAVGGDRAVHVVAGQIGVQEERPGGEAVADHPEPAGVGAGGQAELDVADERELGQGFHELGGAVVGADEQLAVVVVAVDQQALRTVHGIAHPVAGKLAGAGAEERKVDDGGRQAEDGGAVLAQGAAHVEPGQELLVGRNGQVLRRRTGVAEGVAAGQAVEDHQLVAAHRMDQARPVVR